MRLNRSLYFNLITVLLYLVGLQTWFRSQGDTQRVAAVAIMVFSICLVIVHILVLIGGLIASYLRKDHSAMMRYLRLVFLVFIVGLALSYMNGVAVQLFV